jgi:hypothetical protein
MTPADHAAIRRHGYALAELESTLYCFFGGISYLSVTPNYDDPKRGSTGLIMLETALDWEERMMLECPKPEEAA